MDDIEEELFSLFKVFENKGCIYIMKGLDKSKPDFKVLLTLATLFAREGHKVTILTDCHFKSVEYQIVYGRLNGTKYERKCPDMLIDGNYYEYVGYVKPWNIKKVSRMFSHGLKQSDRLIINNTKGCSDRYLRRQIADRLNIHMPIKEIWTYEKGSKRLIFKEGKFYKDNNREA
jgi:hypothetical protein